ncbi:conserved hypothetical membrane protein [Thermoplasma acidophilum]|uniref:Conserved hypothetical membrane protein n=1 Tax=Thermoplasma acidophilum (strain ATCC 25905 / DSM 1728 / JCM 9062 / NBRC 15155 / AMRC-C165) TaxID=273075 RepID=Q9HJP9_THEAC|nr:hypothetical protein [Thermoplasma acidophilum]MCY0852279.1 hypothetical protein [Thermoplasma acidophilum]CAC12047.1 conserved hypothetical membrane protein [Thermoplasma acidophilum]
MENISKESITEMVINVGVMLPPIFMAAYILPRVYPYANLFILFLFASLPVVRRLLGNPYRNFVYPVALIIVAASVLIWLAALTGSIPHKYMVLGTPVNEPFMVSVTLVIGIVSLLEGIFARKIYSVVTLMAFSTLSFLDMIAAFIVFRETGYAFFTSYVYVELMEYEAVYTLVVYGYEFSLPLATFVIPINSYLIASFVLSMVSIIAASYRNGNRSIDRSSSFAYSILYGSILGAAAFYFITAMSRFSLQFLAISIVIVAMVYAIIRTDPGRKSEAK